MPDEHNDRNERLDYLLECARELNLTSTETTDGVVIRDPEDRERAQKVCDLRRMPKIEEAFQAWRAHKVEHHRSKTKARREQISQVVREAGEALSGCAQALRLENNKYHEDAVRIFLDLGWDIIFGRQEIEDLAQVRIFFLVSEATYEMIRHTLLTYRERFRATALAFWQRYHLTDAFEQMDEPVDFLTALTTS